MLQQCKTSKTIKQPNRSLAASSSSSSSSSPLRPRPRPDNHREGFLDPGGSQTMITRVLPLPTIHGKIQTVLDEISLSWLSLIFLVLHPIGNPSRLVRITASPFHLLLVCLKRSGPRRERGKRKWRLERPERAVWTMEYSQSLRLSASTGPSRAAVTPIALTIGLSSLKSNVLIDTEVLSSSLAGRSKWGFHALAQVPLVGRTARLSSFFSNKSRSPKPSQYGVHTRLEPRLGLGVNPQSMSN